MCELIGETNVLNDWDYDNVKQAITENTHAEYLYVKTGSNITIKTLSHMGDVDRDNLGIFKELYRARPHHINQPVVNLTVPAAPIRYVTS